MSSKRNRDVAHEWAHGRDIKTGRNNVFAEGGTIYSYGRHFPVARFYGSDTVLFTSRGYSNSTSRHKVYVRGAIPSRCRVFVVDAVCGLGGGDLTKPQHKVNHRLLVEHVAHCVQQSERPRLRADTRSAWLASAERALIEANDYRARFKLGGKPIAGIGVAADKVRGILRAAEVQRAKDSARRAEAQRVAALREADRLAEWVAGGNNAQFFGDCPVAFRLRADSKGRIVQSSKGAEFTAAAARAAYPRLMEIRAGLSGAGEYVPAADCRADDVLTISGFRTERVDADGVLVGCHDVSWQAVDDLAKLLGVGAEGVICE